MPSSASIVERTVILSVLSSARESGADAFVSFCGKGRMDRGEGAAIATQPQKIAKNIQVNVDFRAINTPVYCPRRTT
jgi:hypothetical protein